MSTKSVASRTRVGSPSSRRWRSARLGSAASPATGRGSSLTSGCVARPACRQPARPPRSTATRENPCPRSHRATRALVASPGHEQYTTRVAILTPALWPPDVKDGDWLVAAEPLGEYRGLHNFGAVRLRTRHSIVLFGAFTALVRNGSRTAKPLPDLPVLRPTPAITRAGGARRCRRRVHREVRRSHIAASVQPKQAGPVKHGGNLDDAVPQPIYDAVVAMDDLAERLAATSGTTRPERGLLSSSATAATICSTTRSA